MEHLPVMYEQALECLAIKKDGIYIDCTFGLGGHTRGILRKLGQNGRLFALDRDPQAITYKFATDLLKDHRLTLLNERFSKLEEIAENLRIFGQVDGILIDLGVSSPQLDKPERGFSFLRDGPLDMRMDSNCGISARQWLANVDEKTLTKVLFEYGEERFAQRIAKAIVRERLERPISTTKELAELVERTMPVKEKFKHPATRTFQAIRIEINQELEELKQVLQQSSQILKAQGRIVVISFHSLEDRIVKRFFRQESGAKFDPGKLPIKESDIAKGIFKTIGKAIKPSLHELTINPRSRSAIMRTAEKI